MIICQSCGSTNEATYKFCRSCGTPLAAIARAEATSTPTVPTPEPEAAADNAASPPAASPPAPPPASPPATPPASPVVAPPGARQVAPTVAPPLVGARPPGPRVPPPVMIGALVAVLGIGAAAGIVLGRGPVDPDPGTKPGGTSTAESPRPSAESSRGPATSALPTSSPSPSAPSTPRPSVPTPTIAPTPTTGTGGTDTAKEAKARYVAVTIPTDWEVKSNDFTVTVYPTAGGSLFLESGALTNAGAPKTTAAWIQGEIAWRQKQFPDVKVCGAEEDFQVFNGPAGRAVTLCYTATTTGGASYPAIVHVFGAIIMDGNDTLLFHQKIYAKADAWENVLAAVNPVLHSTRWTLFKGG